MVGLSPYRVSEKALDRTRQLAAFDPAKLRPGAADLGCWVRGFLDAATALQELGVRRADLERGTAVQATFLDVASPVPSVATLRAPTHEPRVLEFELPAPGWCGVAFDSRPAQAAGAGAAAARRTVKAA